MTQERHHASNTAQVADIGRASLPTGGLGSELAAILGSCNDRLHHLQAQAADVVFAELAIVQSAWLRAVTAVADLAPREIDQRNALRLIEIVNDWFRTVARTQTALIDLVGKSALSSVPPVAANNAADVPSSFDRRQRATIIDFPDRRRIKVA